MRLNALHRLGRRWPLTLVLALVSMLIGLTVFSFTPASYQRSTSVTMVPSVGSLPNIDNPFLYSGNLIQTADVVVSAVNANPDVRELTATYPGTSLSIARDYTSSGPIVDVEVTASSDRVARVVIARALVLLSTTFSTIQRNAGVTSRDEIHALNLTPTPVPSTSERLPVTTGLAALLVALALSFVIVLAVDVLLSGSTSGERSSRRAAERPAKSVAVASRSEPAPSLQRGAPDAH